MTAYAIGLESRDGEPWIVVEEISSGNIVSETKLLNLVVCMVESDSNDPKFDKLQYGTFAGKMYFMAKMLHAMQAAMEDRVYPSSSSSRGL